MSRKTTVCLSAIYLFPFALQCFVNNLMPIYVSSLGFATEKTVGEVAGVGAIMTAISLLVWSFFAGRARKKSRVLALSLGLVFATSLLFLLKDMTYIKLMIFVVLFYSCYMSHQPIVDTIVSESYTRTKHSFAFFRAFASLGYAAAGLLIAILPNDNPTLFFAYIAVLAIVSLIFALLHRDEKSVAVEKTSSSVKLNFDFFKFCLFVMIMFFSSSILATFTGVFFTGQSHLGGDVEIFGILVAVSSVAEWLLIVVLAKWTEKADTRIIFMLIALSGVGRSVILALSPSSAVASLSFLFNPLYFALLGACAAPYIKRIAPEGSNAFAQGVFTFVSFGVGTFLGSYIGGIIAENLGMRNMFFIVTLLYIALLPLSFVLIKGNNKKNSEEQA